MTGDTEQTKHSKSDEANLRRHLKREEKRLNKKMDEFFVRELEDIYVGRSEVFKRLREGSSYRRTWRCRDSVIPNHEADLVFTKEDGKPVITILDIVYPDETTAIEMMKKEIGSGRDSQFNDLPEGGAYEAFPWEGPGKDIWHFHRMRIAKDSGKPVITIVEYTIDYGTKWG
ncbi:MAG: hypothetical protein C4K49_07870 [Candidatus Thorarchaeota archaeon]|nr:MAG: hypothetical protein C4K49_07870 [Candidatus Thorarchaeota archaeon]